MASLALGMIAEPAFVGLWRLLDGLAWTIDCDGRLKEHHHCGGHGLEELLLFRVLRVCQ